MSGTSPVPLDIIKKLSQTLGPNWQELGRELKISEADIQNIKNDNCGNSTEGLYNLLRHWRNKNYEKATAGALKSALIRIGRSDLSYELFADENYDESIRYYESPERTVSTECSNTDCEHNDNVTPLVPLDVNNNKVFKGARELRYTEKSQRKRKTPGTSKKDMKREKHPPKKEKKKQRYHHKSNAEPSSTEDRHEDKENRSPKITNININIQNVILHL